MRLAWFRPAPADGRRLDAAAPLIAALRRAHVIDIVTEAEAHDFVWKHDRAPYDICVYDIRRTPAGAFPWPYLLHYPGVLVLRDISPSDPRGRTRSLAIVVADEAVARSLHAEWPEARVRVVPLGWDPVEGTTEPIDPARRPEQTPIQLALLENDRRDVVERAVARAARRGAAVTLLSEAPPAELLCHADVVAALEWPPAAGPPFAALAAMAAGLAVIVLEVEATAGWPALDPQTWLPRGFTRETPVAVSLDPRDEEHSLMLALVRLSADARLRETLGLAARAWWHAHARIDDAAAAFEEVLRESVTLGPAGDGPVLDGSERAREVLAEIGVGVDFL